MKEDVERILANVHVGIGYLENKIPNIIDDDEHGLAMYVYECLTKAEKEMKQLFEKNN